MVSCIKIAISSVNSAKIILGPLVLPWPTRLLLQFLVFVKTLVCAGYSSNIANEVRN